MSTYQFTLTVECYEAPPEKALGEVGTQCDIESISIDGEELPDSADLDLFMLRQIGKRVKEQEGFAAESKAEHEYVRSIEC